MLELIVQLELIRESIRRKMLPKVSSNDYLVVSTFIALILSSGTLITGFTLTEIALPGIAFSLVTFVIGILAILSIILLPVGLIIL